MALLKAKNQRERNRDSETEEFFIRPRRLTINRLISTVLSALIGHGHLQTPAWQDLWSIRASRVIERDTPPNRENMQALVDIIVIDSFPTSPLLILHSSLCIYIILPVCTGNHLLPLSIYILLPLIESLLIRNTKLLRHHSCLPLLTSRPP